MEQVRERSVDQERWNRRGIERATEIESDTDSYILSDCPLSRKESYGEVMRVLSPVDGKSILELGCGEGDLSVWLAKRGAHMAALDIGPDLIAAAKLLAGINGVSCDFRTANIIGLPFNPAAFDAVIGFKILHHLSEADVLKALGECHRVLKPGGIAVFEEPVENSRLFDLIQQLFPAGVKGSGYYRPSILQWKAWTSYVGARDDRSMTSRELISAGQGLFPLVRTFPYGFLIRLTRLLGEKYRNTLLSLDRILFKYLPPLKRYSKTVLVEYQK